jgi:mannose-6-phosphate isomerase-like protein (cupin superfamily)
LKYFRERLQRELRGLPEEISSILSSRFENRRSLIRLHGFSKASQKLARKPNGQEAEMLDVILKRFENPDETRTFPKGKFELVRIGGMSIGRATYAPGWRWSADVGAATGAKMCEVEHVGMVISGCSTAAMADGRVIEMRAGDVFYVPPGHDSWVVGDEPYISLHFLGTEAYAAKPPL